MSDPKTIVVIDDEIRICQSFERVLQRQGYAVETFTRGAQALERLARGGVDLVVSDLMMPDKSGADILREMTARAINTPLVMITGYASADNAMESMRLGAVDYLPKPFTVEELKAVVGRGLAAGAIDAARLPAAPPGTFEIRRHSWARRQGAEVIAGVHPFVLACSGAVEGVELPLDEDELTQGGAFGKLQMRDSRVPVRLWAPLSGVVKATNPQVAARPALLASDPYGEGWLIRLAARDFDQEVRRLIPSGPAA